MSLIWPNKDPDELLDYSVDWTDVTIGLIINSIVWSVRSNVYAPEVVLEAGRDLTFATNSVRIDSIQNIAQALEGGKIAVIYVGGGIHGVDYTFICTCTTNINTVIQRAVILRCRNK